MATIQLPLHDGLLDGTRLRGFVSRDQPASLVEVAALFGFGVLAAIASECLEFGLRIPGHAILRVVFPMALGLALVPRRGAGSIMGLSALGAGLLLRTTHFPAARFSLGALTSLTLTGPLLDMSLRHATRGWRMYISFGLAGLMSNTAALLVRGGAKFLGLEHMGARPLMEWLPPALVSYTVCGAVAGVISGWIWFHGRRPTSPQPEEPAA